MGGRSEALRVTVKSLRLERTAEHPQCGTMTAHLAPPTSRYDIKGYEMRFKESISSSLACPVRNLMPFMQTKSISQMKKAKSISGDKINYTAAEQKKKRNKSGINQKYFII